MCTIVYAPDACTFPKIKKIKILIRSVRLIRIALKNGYIVKTNNGYALVLQYALKRPLRLKIRVYKHVRLHTHMYAHIDSHYLGTTENTSRATT